MKMKKITCQACAGKDGYNKETMYNRTRKKAALDLTGCNRLGELHQRIKEAFDFPDFYGELIEIELHR